VSREDRPSTSQIKRTAGSFLGGVSVTNRLGKFKDSEIPAEVRVRERQSRLIGPASEEVGCPSYV